MRSQSSLWYHGVPVSYTHLALSATISPRIDASGGIVLDGISLTGKQLRQINRLYIVACGSAYHAGVVGKYVLEKLTRIPVEVDLASEFRYRDPIVDKKTLVIIISQSGETADTLAALREAKRRGARVLSVVNVVGSSIASESDDVLYTCLLYTSIGSVHPDFHVVVNIPSLYGVSRHRGMKRLFQGYRRFPGHAQDALAVGTVGGDFKVDDHIVQLQHRAHIGTGRPVALEDQDAVHLRAGVVGFLEAQLLPGAKHAVGRRPTKLAFFDMHSIGQPGIIQGSGDQRPLEHVVRAGDDPVSYTHLFSG